MTALKDAFAKAGMDTKKIDLRAAAVEALDAAKGNISRAATRFSAILAKRGELRETIAREYLDRLAIERGADAGKTEVPPPAAGSIKVRQHQVRQHNRRTHEQKQSALQAAGHAAASMATAYDRKIDERAIGEIRWGELQALTQGNAANAASLLRLGTEATANFLLLAKIESHCQVDDHTRKVRDVISAEQLQIFSDEADAEAPHVVGDGINTYVAWLNSRKHRKQIEQAT